MPENEIRGEKLDSRVAAIEADVSNIRVGFDRFETDVRAEFASLRRDLISNGRTNWGWIFAAASIAVALIGAVGASLVRPLQIADDQAARRLSAVEARLDEVTETTTRTDERLRVYAEYGEFPKAKTPTP